MSEARVEQQQQPATGAALLVLVGLSIAFALLVALLAAAKTHSGPIYGESNMLYTALVLYAGAATLYMGYGVTGIVRFVNTASVLTALGFAANTAAVAHRWSVAGRPPFSNMYEMLLSFVWTLALLTLIAERAYKVKIIGSITMPITVVSVILMQLLPSDVRPLVPALQSTWLQVHVTLAMLSYAACAVSFALAMMFLIQDNMSTEAFQAITSGGMIAVYVGILATRFRAGALAVTAYDLDQKTEVMISRGHPLFIQIPDLGWLYLLVLLSTVAPLLLYIAGRVKKDSSFFDTASKGMFISMLLQAAGLAIFIVRVKNGQYGSPDAEGLFGTALPANPFLLSGMVGGIVSGLLYLLLLWRREGLQKMMPSANDLDRVTYKIICIAFPLLTLMIAAGAYWANQTWGSYWSWDPKETWAAITWLIYAGYLHMRITRGWKGRRAAWFAILGFGVVIFTFFGVTYLLPGLHAYAAG
jgi:ABC-type transport system involved in cytochrome c biogenesis permease subunit